MREGLLILPCLALSLAGASLAGCSSEEVKELKQVAVVSHVAGSLDFKGAGGTDWHPARVGFKLSPGDAVRTGPDSRAEIQVRGPNSKIRVGENSLFELSYSTEAEGKALQSRLIEGNIWGKVEKLGEQDKFAFETGLATAEVRGSTLRMVASGDTAVTVYAYDGVVEVKTQVSERGAKRTASFNLGRGQLVRISTNGPPETGVIPADDPWRNGWQPKKLREIQEEELSLPVPIRIEEKPTARGAPSPVLSKMKLMQQEMLEVAPQVFSEVRLKREGDRLLTDEDLLRASEDPSLNAIEIRVMAKAWDALPSKKKEELVFSTFEVLKEKYPGITRFLTLTFDDGRSDLKLDYSRFSK